MVIMEKYNIMKYYKTSVKELRNTICRNNKTITEVDWNRIAKENNYLSSETIGYISKTKFNKLCKKILKRVKKTSKIQNK